MQELGDWVKEILRRDVKFWASATTILFNVLTAVAICAGFYQFNQQLEAKRTEQSIALLDLWEKDKFREKYDLLRRSVAAQLTDLEPADKTYLISGDLKGIVLAKYNIGKKALAEANHDTSSVEDIFYFLNKVAICIENSMCSRRASSAFLYETASSFWMYFGWYAENQRSQGYDGFAIAAERFARGHLLP